LHNLKRRPKAAAALDDAPNGSWAENPNRMQAGAVDQCELLRTNVAQVQYRHAVAFSSGCQVRILSIEFSIPYLLNDEK
jgi:hypothetical protein